MINCHTRLHTNYDRMRVLFLTHRIPFPPDKGDKIRSFHIMDYLAQRHDVYLATMIEDSADVRFVARLKPRVSQILYYKIWPLGGRAKAITAIARSHPITVNYFYRRRLQVQIDALIDEVNFDVYFCFSSPMAEYLFRSRHAGGKISRATRVMDLIDVDSYKWSQYALRSDGVQARIYRYEARHLADYEKRIAGYFDRMFLVSEQEMAYFPGGAAATRLGVMSNGVDMEFFTPSLPIVAKSAGPSLLFTGVMDYRPNVEGVRWFVERIYPRIQALVPAVRFYIVGRRPTAEVRRLAQRSGVVVTGFVEDIRDYLADAAVCVVPLRIARGVQNKVLEAMAMAKAVVATTAAVEGILARPGEDLLVADDEESFARAVLELLTDPWKVQRIGLNARQCVEKYYSWDKNLRQLDTLR
jgi:sugar transferase (PEP-CTERM/EpsH1 system associated)